MELDHDGLARWSREQYEKAQRDREDFRASQKVSGRASRKYLASLRKKSWWQVLAALLAIGCAHTSIYDEGPQPRPRSDSVRIVIQNERSNDALDPRFYLVGSGRWNLGIVRGMGGHLDRTIPVTWLGGGRCATIEAHYPGGPDLVYEQFCVREGDYIDVRLDDIFVSGAAWSHR